MCIKEFKRYFPYRTGRVKNLIKTEKSLLCIGHQKCNYWTCVLSCNIIFLQWNEIVSRNEHTQKKILIEKYSKNTIKMQVCAAPILDTKWIFLQDFFSINIIFVWYSLLCDTKLLLCLCCSKCTLHFLLASQLFYVCLFLGVS